MGAEIIMALLVNIAIVFALGYWILTTSVKQENWLKSLGFILGWIIIGLSAVFILMSVLDTARMYNERRMMMENYKSMQQHHMQKNNEMMQKNNSQSQR